MQCGHTGAATTRDGGDGGARMAAEVDFEGFSEGSLESLGGGRWRSRFSRTTAHGREQVSRTFQAKGERAAKRRAEEIRRGLDERERRRELPLKVTDEDMLLPNFQERYIGALEAGDGIAPTTAANYRHCAQHVCRYLGKARVDEITGDMVLRMQSMLLADELCPNTVARAHRFLKQALRYAVDEGIIARSPFTRHVKAPRRTQPEPNSLDRDERERLPSWLDSVGDTEVTLAIRLGLACGLRREEMCGLRWRDVDLDLHLLRVRVAVSQCEGKAFVKRPKTPRSRRDVPLEPDLEARLARRRKRVARECSPEARERVGDLYVLGNARGDYYVVVEFRNTSTHFVTDEYELFYGPVLQESVHYYEEKLRELHGIEISDRIPENYLALSVRRGTLDLDTIKARYPREVVEKMLELGSSIAASKPSGAGITYATELRLTKKHGEGIPVRIANDSDAAVTIIKSLTDPVDKYIYRTKSAVAFIRRRLDKEDITLRVKGEPKRFNNFHFKVFADFYDMKGSERYSYDLSLGGEQPSWCYSQQAIDLILQEIRRDPGHVIDSMRNELARRSRASDESHKESRPQEQGNSKQP